MTDVEQLARDALVFPEGSPRSEIMAIAKAVLELSEKLRAAKRSDALMTDVGIKACQTGMEIEKDRDHWRAKYEELSEQLRESDKFSLDVSARAVHWRVRAEAAEKVCEMATRYCNGRPKAEPLSVAEGRLVEALKAWRKTKESGT